MLTRLTLAAALAAATTALAGCGDLGGMTAQSAPVSSGHIPAYSRNAFGGWIDADHDGCDTRAEVLEAAAGPAAFDDADRNHCRDDAPVRDTYTGRMVSPAKADIDHALPLEAAWYAGMWRRSETDRVAYANDRRNLIVTAASVNRSKGSDLPPTWAPPNPAARCRFAQVVLGTERNWHLTLPGAQHSALTQMLDTCH